MALNVLKVNLVFTISDCTYLIQATVEDTNVTNLYIPCLTAESPPTCQGIPKFQILSLLRVQRTHVWILQIGGLLIDGRGTAFTLVVYIIKE